MKKELLGGTKMIKKLSEPQKMRFKALLQNTSTSDSQSWYSMAQKAAAQAVKISKERCSKKFGRLLDSNYLLANKVFRLIIRRLRGKSLSTTNSIKDSTVNILNDEKEILSRWSEYFEDLLNPVRESPTDTCDTIVLRKKKSSHWHKWQQPYKD